MEPIGIGVMLFVFVIWAIMECRKSPEERVAEKQIKLEKMKSRNQTINNGLGLVGWFLRRRL